MMEVRIDKALKERCPRLRLGCVQAEVTVGASPQKLLELLRGREKEICGAFTLEDVARLGELAASREAYKSLGKNPSRYRNSAEALLRRILLGKGIYYINNVVDVNNFISLQSNCSVGSYDVGKLRGAVSFTIGRKGECYTGIGKELSLDIENLPILEDDIGKFGSPTSDSERAMITADTKSVLMIVFSFGGDDRLTEHLTEAAGLLTRYASARNAETTVI